MRNVFSVRNGPATVMLEGVELKFIDRKMGFAYMYVRHNDNRSAPSFSFWKNNPLYKIR
jgi:hypothetical protein